MCGNRAQKAYSFEQSFNGTEYFHAYSYTWVRQKRTFSRKSHSMIRASHIQGANSRSLAEQSKLRKLSFETVTFSLHKGNGVGKYKQGCHFTTVNMSKTARQRHSNFNTLALAPASKMHVWGKQDPGIELGVEQGTDEVIHETGLSVRVDFICASQMFHAGSYSLDSRSSLLLHSIQLLPQLKFSSLRITCVSSSASTEIHCVNPSYSSTHIHIRRHFFW